MINNKAKLEIINWLNSNRDYDKGCTLFIKYGKNKVLARTFPGRERRYKEKLASELAKLAGVSIVQRQGKSKIQKAPPANNMPKSNNPPKPPKNDGKKEKDSQIMPKVIVRLIYTQDRLYKKRAELWKERSKIPQKNTETYRIKRVELNNAIEEISKQLDVFYHIRKAYEEKGTLPKESELFPESEKKVEKIEFTDMDPIKLHKRLTNLRSNITKYKNQLDYQDTKKGKTKKPMPEGPKRKEIENKLKEKQSESDAIAQYLNSIN